VIDMRKNDSEIEEPSLTYPSENPSVFAGRTRVFDFLATFLTVNNGN